MKDNVNTLFAIFIITVAGAAATLLIYHLATSNNISNTINANNVNGTEGSYSDLQQSILK